MGGLKTTHLHNALASSSVLTVRNKQLHSSPCLQEHLYEADEQPPPCGSCLSLFVIICHTKHYHLCSSSNSTCTALHCLQEHLYEADEQAPLRQVAWDRLLQLFGDLEDSWASADGRALFQQLPLRAVAALAKSDSLAVASENTVFAGEGVWSKAVITSSGCSVSCAWEGGKCSCADSWFVVWKFVASGVC